MLSHVVTVLGFHYLVKMCIKKGVIFYAVSNNVTVYKLVVHGERMEMVFQKFGST